MNSHIATSSCNSGLLCKGQPSSHRSSRRWRKKKNVEVSKMLFFFIAALVAIGVPRLTTVAFAMMSLHKTCLRPLLNFTTTPLSLSYLPHCCFFSILLPPISSILTLFASFLILVWGWQYVPISVGTDRQTGGSRVRTIWKWPGMYACLWIAVQHRVYTSLSRKFFSFHFCYVLWHYGWWAAPRNK